MGMWLDQMRGFVEGENQVRLAHVDRDGAYARIGVTLERVLYRRVGKADKAICIELCSPGYRGLRSKQAGVNRLRVTRRLTCWCVTVLGWWVHGSYWMAGGHPR